VRASPPHHYVPSVTDLDATPDDGSEESNRSSNSGDPRVASSKLVVRREHPERLKKVTYGLRVRQDFRANDGSDGSVMIRSGKCQFLQNARYRSACSTHSTLRNKSGSRIMMRTGTVADSPRSNSTCACNTEKRMNREAGCKEVVKSYIRLAFRWQLEANELTDLENAVTSEHVTGGRRPKAHPHDCQRSQISLPFILATVSVL
jgi:hypothetical protein